MLLMAERPSPSSKQQNTKRVACSTLAVPSIYSIRDWSRVGLTSLAGFSLVTGQHDRFRATGLPLVGGFRKAEQLAVYECERCAVWWPMGRVV